MLLADLGRRGFGMLSIPLVGLVDAFRLHSRHDIECGGRSRMLNKAECGSLEILESDCGKGWKPG